MLGGAVIADGEHEVLRGVREILRRGASQVKMMAGGGIASTYDPIDVTQYTEGEIRAGVAAAENWGTYVIVHAYTPRAVRTAIRAGVRCIEHGQLLDEETVAMMAENGIWWCLQPFLDDEDTPPWPGRTERSSSRGRRHGQRVRPRTSTRRSRLGHRHPVRCQARDTPGGPARQDDPMVQSRGNPTEGDGPQRRTARPDRAAESLPRRLGVVEEGALADLILVDGDPVADIALITRPQESFLAIIKGGQLVKGTDLSGGC